jgi:pimeloyl-[acyl-carrier protein] methyl ester esterase
VLGWSLGGLVAMQWALARPGRIARLVLVATSPSFVTRDGWRDAMAPETLARFGDELQSAYRLTLLRFLTLQVQGSDEGRATLAQLRTRLFERGDPSPKVLAGALELLGSTDLRPMLAGIGVPTLVIAGDRDALVPCAATVELAQALPQATQVTIGGAAHAPFLSHRRAFLEAALPFLDG